MSARPRFRTIRKSLAPRWLTEGDGELLGYALDLVKDAFVERVRQGLMIRFPQQGPDGTPAPADALAAMGRDRRVVKGIFDTDTAYAVKLLNWLEDRPTQGNPYTLLKKLAEYCGPLPSFRTVDARGNWYSRDADGTESALLKQENWDWDATSIGDRWSRFWVIVYPNGLWTEAAYDWGDTAGPGWGESTTTTGTIGSTAPIEHVTNVRGLIADWMPAGTRCVNIIVALDASSFNPAAPEPDGLWGRWSKNVAGVQVPARLSTARYWDGVTR